jgi:hypothetical protein
VLGEIAGSLSILYESGFQLAGMVYMHRINDTKMSGAAIKSLRIFEKLCGETTFSRVVLASSMWDRMERLEGGLELAKSRERWLSEKQEFWGNMINGGARRKRFRADTRSAQNIVDVLMAQAHPVTLDIQRQMIDQRCSLEETTAGQYVNEEMNKARKRQEKELKDLRASLQEALEDRDEDLARELGQQEQEYKAKMAMASAEVQQLRANFDDLADTGSESYIKLSRQLAEEMEDERARAQITVHEEEPERISQSQELSGPPRRRASGGLTRRSTDDSLYQRVSASQYGTMDQSSAYTISVRVTPSSRRQRRTNHVDRILGSLLDVLRPQSSRGTEWVIPAGSGSIAIQAARTAFIQDRSRRC